MLTLNVDIRASTEDGLVLRLEAIAGFLSEGYTSGEGFQVTGEEEDEEEEA